MMPAAGAGRANYLLGSRPLLLSLLVTNLEGGLSPACARSFWKNHLAASPNLLPRRTAPLPFGYWLLWSRLFFLGESLQSPPNRPPASSDLNSRLHEATCPLSGGLRHVSQPSPEIYLFSPLLREIQVTLRGRQLLLARPPDLFLLLLFQFDDAVPPFFCEPRGRPLWASDGFHRQLTFEHRRTFPLVGRSLRCHASRWFFQDLILFFPSESV